MGKSIRISLAIALLLCFAGAAFAIAPQATRIVSANSKQIDIHFSLPELQVKSINSPVGQYHAITAAGADYTAQTGLPEVPYYTLTFAIPATGIVSLSIDGIRQDWQADLKPAPAQDKDDISPAAWQIDQQFYSSGSLYPARTAIVSEPVILRDFRLVTVNIYPLQWDATANRMQVTRQADLRLSFADGQGINEIPGFTGSYSPLFAPLYESVIDNFYQYRDENDNPPVSPKVLLIHGNSTAVDFIARITDFVAWKRQKGYTVSSVSTAVTGTSNTAIKAYIQTQYSNLTTRPDYVILLGDVTGSYPIPSWPDEWSGSGGEGDYPYTHLSGNDEIGDCYIGRISAENLSQLDVILAKIYLYEKNINVNPTAAAWLDRMLLVGDPSHSGVSTITTNKFIKEISKQVNPDYTYTEIYGGNFAGDMNAAINMGVGVMDYRGYLGMSGWSPSSSLLNGFKLPHAVIITCGTGSYNGTDDTESFIRLGTAASPTGAVTAIGMATTGTHTGFNNSLTGGIFNGIYSYGMRSMGEALLAGRTHIEKVYGNSNPNQAHYFAHWCNLMGDPTLEVFTSIPGTLNIDVPASIPSGLRQLEITVTDGEGLPVKYACVTAYHAVYGVIMSGYTDAGGNILFNLPNAVTSNLLFTASKHEYKPVQANVAIDPLGAINVDGFIMVDDNGGQAIGNSDGLLNAGETIECLMQIRNTTAQTVSGITGTLSTDNPNINFITSTAVFPALESGMTTQNSIPFVFSVANTILPTEDIRFTAQLSDGTNNWSNYYHVSASNLQLSLSQMQIVGGTNSVVDPGEIVELRITVQNSSSLFGSVISAELNSLNDMLQVTDSLIVYENIPANGTALPQSNFTIHGRPQLIAGMQIPMQVRFFNASGYSQLLDFNLSIGTPSAHTPMGPDAYGYFIYDMTDTAYPDCPTYQWMEISPALGGNGTSLNLADEQSASDEGDQDMNNKLAVVSLPFPFGFYGQEYNQITVCVNGFIAMGVSENSDFRNYRLPGAMGPSPMLAPFWDDLCTNGGGQVYKYFDSVSHTFIIQYQNMKNGYNRTSEETFQVIFYDPAFYPTGLGDGMIKYQYKVFNNVDIGSTGYSPAHGNYSTIGIKNATNRIGLEYSYSNTYPTTAAPLGNETALLITTVPVLHEAPYLVIGETMIMDSNHDENITPGETLEIGIRLNNLGTNAAGQVTLSLITADPYVSIINGTTGYDNIAGSDTGMNNTPLVVQVLPDCPDNHSVNLNCNIVIAGNSWVRPINFTVKRPALEYAASLINDYTANGNGVADPGETIKLIINLTNPTDILAQNVTAILTTANPNVSIANTQGIFGDIPAHMMLQKAFEVTFSNVLPLGTVVNFDLIYQGDSIDANTETVNVSCGVSGLNMNFEQNNGGLVPEQPGGWAWGSDTNAGAHSGNLVWGTVLNADYPNSASFQLVSEDIQIGMGAWLEFFHWYSTEEGWDGGCVKISTDDGNNWTLITPDGGYPDGMVNALGSEGYSGDQTTWTLARFNLNAYGNSTVKIRWDFGSDSIYNGIGWYIDDVSVSGSISNTGMINGEVTLGSENISCRHVLISSDAGYATHPESNGSYTLYLPYSTYDVTASLLSHQDSVYSGASLSGANPILLHDFYLGYFQPVTNINPTELDGQIQLSWSAPVDPEFPVVDYKIFQRYNAGRFELLSQTSATTLIQPFTEQGSYQYYVIVNYGVGESSASQILYMDCPYVDLDEDPLTPVITTLKGNFPNPFNPATAIAFSLSKTGKVCLQIYNVKGQLVRTLFNAQLTAGNHQIVWDGTNNAGSTVGSGMYLYRLETDGYQKTMKAMLLK